MAEEESRKPLSLNQRHSRLLLDLSSPASQSRPSSMSSSHFPHTEKEKPSKIKLEGRRRLCKSSINDNTIVNDVDDEAPQFSGIVDFDSPPKEEKPEKIEKVKLEGRRRLCKVSSRDENDNLRLRFSEISDFDSPVTAKNVNKCDDGGANEIRDILNDLSSKLDLLSIEKKIIPKKVDLIENSYSRSFGDEEIDLHKAADLFVPSDSTLDVDGHSRVGVETKAGLYNNGEDLLGNSEEDSFVRMNRVQIAGKRHIENEASWGYEKNETMGQSLVSNVEEEQEDVDDDDGCVVLGNKGLYESAERQGSKFDVEPESLNGVDVSDDDGCVVLGNKGLYKRAERQDTKFNGEPESSDGVDVSDVDDSVSEDLQSITLNGSKSMYKLPGKLAKMLYPHQRDGLWWLWSLHCQGKGGILGDDMGLGKTMQICGFLAGLFQSCLIKRALIVAPKTLLSHWIKELSVVGLSEKTREYYGTCARARQYELQYILQDKGVLLTTYDIVRNNSKSLRGDFYSNDEISEDSITWDYMILDEGHLIKNPNTQRAKSLLEIPSAHRIVISGTPIQNNLKELWALFNFCCPELLGDKNWFKEKYEYKILRGNDKDASDRDKRIGSATAKELRERIQPYFLRRLKSEVFLKDGSKTAKLSKKNEMIVWLKLTSCQRQLYEAFLNSELVLSAFDGSPLAALTILKKICDHPMLLTKRAAEDVLEGMDSMLNQEDMSMAEKLAMHIADINERENLQEMHNNVSCKISFILSLLDNLIPEGHNVLIFSQTRKMLNLIQESLISNGYKFLRIDGTTKAIDRVNIVNDFQEGVGAPIFLLTSQVGGLGLTLTKADRVIVVDPAWNPSTDSQSVDRAYRIGQKKDVLVYRLMTCGTVEEKIYRKQVFKGGLFKTATEHKEQIRYFSQQDLRELFSLPKQGFDVSLTQQQLHEEHDSQYAMDDFLKGHIKFLETKGIAGVSHHSLLFSKTAPAPVAEEEEEEKRFKGTAPKRISSSNSSLERDVDGAIYAFNPKDVSLRQKNSPVKSPSKLTESDIKARINRLTQIFADKVTILKLPDKGARIHRQLAELNSELEKMRSEKSFAKEIIDLDDVTDELQRVLNVSC